MALGSILDNVYLILCIHPVTSTRNFVHRDTSDYLKRSINDIASERNIDYNSAIPTTDQINSTRPSRVCHIVALIQNLSTFVRDSWFLAC